MDNYINFLAAQLAKRKIDIVIEDEGFAFKAKGYLMRENGILISQCLKHGHELNEFYRKRLDKVIA